MLERRLTSGVGVFLSAVAVLAGCQPEERKVVDLDWRKTYVGTGGAQCGGLLEADGGGFFLLGTTNMQFSPVRRADIYLIRTDAAGTVLWEKTYGGEFFEWGNAAVRTTDGDLVIAGHVGAPQTEGLDACLLKVDQEGKQLWFRTFPGPLDQMPHGLCATADGGFLLIVNQVNPEDLVVDCRAAGYAGFDGRSSICLIKADRDGQELWRRVFDSGQNVLAMSGVATPEGGTLVLATVMYYPKDDNDIRLLKVDAAGTEAWSRTWSEGQRAAAQVIRCADGNYVIAGGYRPSGVSDPAKTDLLFMKVDPAGEAIWERILGDPRRVDEVKVVAETADGGFIAAGDRTKDRFGHDCHNTLTRLDGEGRVLWHQAWPAKHTMYSAVLQQEGGGYVVAGTTAIDNVGCMMLIKTKPERAQEGR